MNILLDCSFRIDQYAAQQGLTVFVNVTKERNIREKENDEIEGYKISHYQWDTVQRCYNFGAWVLRNYNPEGKRGNVSREKAMEELLQVVKSLKTCFSS